MSILNLRRRSAAGLFVAAALVCAACLPPASASTVIPMNLDTLADHAGQVIVGQVTSVRSYWTEAPRRIESEITFQHVEYLKGTLPTSGSTFSLIVPGGTVGKMTMRIAGAPTYAAGEEWILFLLPEYKTFPVVGVWQGAFRIEADAAGERRVCDVSRRPVSGFTTDGFTRTESTRANVAADRLVSARGARLRTPPCASKRIRPDVRRISCSPASRAGPQQGSPAHGAGRAAEYWCDISPCRCARPNVLATLR